ncbi:MAG: hypothetical protein AAF386_02935 [Pseudomonadota bacterium]
MAFLDQKLIQQRCAINLAALGAMRSRGILPDPDMIAGCDLRGHTLEVDISPRPEWPTPSSANAEALRFDLVARRMYAPFAQELMTSEAFEDYLELYEQWLALRP